MEMLLHEGRPDFAEGRLEKEIRVYDLLDSLQIQYLRTDHGVADTMEACNKIDAVLDVLICKNLFLCNTQKTKFYLLMMPGDKKFKTKDLSKQINSAGYHLQMRNIWNGTWISHRDLSVLWD